MELSARMAWTVTTMLECLLHELITVGHPICFRTAVAVQELRAVYLRHLSVIEKRPQVRQRK